jgi:ABC-2 type transport system ATP-binding protein
MATVATAALDHVTDAAPTLLRISDIAKQYGDARVLADISFDLREGEVLGLIGPNGSGKTTLLESIAGILPVDSGSVFWRGAVCPAANRNQHLFYLPDGVLPWDDQYVVHVLNFFAAVHRRRDRDLAETVNALGLAPVLHKRVHALSKGYCRRLMLALALIAPQPVLLLDEPFDGFDLRQTREVMGLIRRVASSGRTLFVAIHQLGDAARVCDRFVLIADGRVRGLGTIDELRARTSLPGGSLEDVFLALT